MGITTLLEDLTEVADNFVEADLRAAVDFDSTDWEGVRWSPATAWPAGWEDRVRAISVEIAPGVFRVVRDGRRSPPRDRYVIQRVITYLPVGSAGLKVIGPEPAA